MRTASDSRARRLSPGLIPFSSTNEEIYSACNPTVSASGPLTSQRPYPHGNVLPHEKGSKGSDRASELYPHTGHRDHPVPRRRQGAPPPSRKHQQRRGSGTLQSRQLSIGERGSIPLSQTLVRAGGLPRPGRNAAKHHLSIALQVIRRALRC